MTGHYGMAVTPEQQQRIANFWQWFGRGPGAWNAPDDEFDEQRFEPILERLADAFPQLWPDLSWVPDEPYELCFGTRLERAAAPLVRAMVGFAPPAPHWRFIAFRQPVGFHELYVGHLGLPFEQIPVELVKFEVVVREPLTLRLYLPGWTRALSGAFQIAGQLLLQAGMGEAWLLEQLRELEIADLAGAPHCAQALRELSRIGVTGAHSHAEPRH